MVGDGDKLLTAASIHPWIRHDAVQRNMKELSGTQMGKVVSSLLDLFDVHSSHSPEFVWQTRHCTQGQAAGR